ncbi:MAG TPA: autotransporter domain-containing protein [Beijerinckiaceae bacterium]|jgi:outer membrane autotransporter protein
MVARSPLRAWLRSSTLLAGGALAFAGSAQAQDATWLPNPPSGNWNSAVNWSPATVPTGTATFATSSRTDIGFSDLVTSVGTIRFNPGASAYTFTIGPTFRQLNVTGTGIVNNSGATQSFNILNGFLSFSNAATAGSNVRITATDASISFANTSNAGSAVINANGSTSGNFAGSFVGFQNSSSAANSTIAVNQSSFVQFSQNTTAANAAITVTNSSGPNDFPVLFFTNSSTAGNATILNTGSAVPFDFDSLVQFGGTSSAGTSRITNNANGFTFFGNSSTAAGATIVNNGSPTDPSLFGVTQFGGTSTAGNATITNNLGETDFLNNSTAGTATIRNIGLSAAALANNIFGLTLFFGSSTAGNATITTEGFARTLFQQNATAGNATVITNADGATFFQQNATGGNARFVTNAGGVVDFSRVTSGGATAGSIEGGGNYYLGPNRLTVGGNNRSTEVAGAISDCGVTGQQCRAVLGTPALPSTGGALTKIGTGTLTLSGANSYTGGTTISAGTLQLGNGGAAGSILGNVVDNGILAFNRSDVFAFNGAISGTGAVEQRGPGTTVLTAASTYTGPTRINAGTLQVDGSLASTVFVNSGGTLAGTGAVGGLNVLSGGTVAPGPAIGTLTVNGNASFATGSVFAVETNSAGQSDRIAATGSATLNGGTVQVTTQAGLPPPSTTYTILTAAGGVSGTFSSLAGNTSIFVRPSLAYTATSVLLTLARTPFAAFAATPNELAVAGALDAGGGPLALAVFNQNTAAGARQAFAALSGELHPSTASVLIDEARFIRGAVLGRLREAAGDPGAPALAEAGPPAAYAADVPGGALPVVAPPQPSSAVWAQGFGSWGRFDGDGNAARVDRDLAGFIGGFDARVLDFGRVGLAAGYGKSRISGPAGVAEVETAHLAGYLGASFGAFNLRAGAAYAWHGIDTSRAILFPGFSDAATASYDGGTGQVFGEVGYGLRFGAAAVEPFAGLAFVRLRTDAFAERGGSAALRGAATDESVGYSSLGVRLAAAYVLDNGMTIVPRAMIAWQHAFDRVVATRPLAFQNTGAGFLVAGVPIARDSALIDAGLDLRVTRQATIGLSYIGQLADKVQDHGAKGSLVIRF